MTPIHLVGIIDRMDRSNLLWQAGIQEIVISTKSLLLSGINYQSFVLSMQLASASL